MRNRQLVRLAVCLVGMAAMVLQSCMEANGTDCDRLCGSWSSVEGKPDVLVYKEGGGDGLFPQRKDACPETADLPAGRGERQPFHQHRIPY